MVKSIEIRHLVINFIGVLVSVFVATHTVQAEAAQTLEDTFERWSYHTRLDGIEVTATLLSGEIIDRWKEEENSIEVQSKIVQLHNAIHKEGYSVVLFHFRPQGSFFTYSLSPAKDNLYINTPQQPKGLTVHYSSNLDEPISFGQDYYGVAVFKAPIDPFTFPVVSANLVRGAAPQIPCYSYQKNACASKPIRLQFAFMPDGAPQKHRPRAYSSSNVLEIVRLALSVLRFIRV